MAKTIRISDELADMIVRSAVEMVPGCPSVMEAGMQLIQENAPRHGPVILEGGKLAAVFALALMGHLLAIEVLCPDSVEGSPESKSDIH